jgi:hypothetical protein
MPKSSTKSRSKRVQLKTKYKIIKKVKEHKRKQNKVRADPPSSTTHQDCEAAVRPLHMRRLPAHCLGCRTGYQAKAQD